METENVFQLDVDEEHDPSLPSAARANAGVRTVVLSGHTELDCRPT